MSRVIVCAALAVAVLATEAVEAQCAVTAPDPSVGVEVSRCRGVDALDTSDMEGTSC